MAGPRQDREKGGSAACPENICAEGTLECGSSSYRLVFRDLKAAASRPQPKALRAFSFLGDSDAILQIVEERR